MDSHEKEAATKQMKYTPKWKAEEEDQSLKIWPNATNVFNNWTHNWNRSWES